MRVIHRIRQASRACSGSAIIELAFSLPFLVVLLVGTIDFGRVFYAAMTVTHAARAGVAYGTQDGKSNDTTGMQNAAAAAATDVAGFSSTAVRLCACYTTAIPPTPNPPTNAACTATCTGSRWIYVQVTASKTFTTLVTWPGVPSSVTIQRVAKMRTQ
ncbi:MAG TPA: TadE/TadG family type IV pilus assembly protein [Vicinamibacterales bacterium]|nr:TadE/TadG family type IV pilus assembly protein [Vicinamibacterales bacterium]